MLDTPAGTLARVDYDRLRPVNHSPSLLPFFSLYSRNVTIALIVETGSKTIVTSRDKETATFENKRANKLVLSVPLPSVLLDVPSRPRAPLRGVFNIPTKRGQRYRYQRKQRDPAGRRAPRGTNRRKGGNGEKGEEGKKEEERDKKKKGVSRPITAAWVSRS